MGERVKGREGESRENEGRFLDLHQKYPEIMSIERVEDLEVYRTTFRSSMEIFEQSKEWLKVERYALTDQIRRSSRAVCANLSEAWRKRRYPKHFVSKLSDADAEANETRTWLRFARGCEYLDAEAFETLDDRYDRICGGLVQMMDAPEKWCGPTDAAKEPPVPYDPE
jgi:four helix bundle protein